MVNGGVELIGLMQLENRRLKERLIRAIFGPSIVPFIDVGVMEFIALGFELIPLNPGMQDIQNVVKDFGSCTRPLRIIPLVLKPGKMPAYHNDLRGHCHGVTPVLLPTRSVGAPMALHHVAAQLARAKRAPVNPASPAHQAQAQAFH